jgi:hypothetical protein
LRIERLSKNHDTSIPTPAIVFIATLVLKLTPRV